MYYFAYGSNMCTPRLARRVPSVRPIGAAWLAGHRLAWHLKGNDDSGKCNVIATDNAADRVYGVVFELDADQLHDLHAAEGPAYDFLTLDVALLDHRETVVPAAIYRGRADWLDDALVPLAWYRDFVVAGASAHRLPAAWVDQLAAVATQPDADTARAAANREILEEIPSNILD